MPTALERQGDFSQTFDNQNRLIFIRDPLLDGQLRRRRAAGRRASRATSSRPTASIRTAQALLNLFPLPNATDPTGTNQYNYVVPDRAGLAAQRPGAARGLEHRAEHDGLRTPAVRLREALRRRLAARLDRRLAADGDASTRSTRVSYVNTLLHTFSPTTVRRVHGRRELGASVHEPVRPGGARCQRPPARAAGHAAVLPAGEPAASAAAGHLHRRPSGNDRARFGVEQRFPFFGYNTLFNVSGNITKLKGAHNDEDGPLRRAHDAARPRGRRASTATSASTPTARTRSTPTSGSPTRCSARSREYTESDGHPSAHGQFLITEWYAQDNWRVKRNFTLDAGVRFYYMTPTQSEGDQVAQFEPGQLHSRAGAASCIQPISTPQGRRARQPADRRDPAGGLHRPAGAGLRQLHQRHGRCTTARRSSSSPFRVAPRLGFAWDVTGDGRTAVRGGAGVFYDRYHDDNILDLIELPPVLNTYRTNYTTISELLVEPADARRRPPCGGSTQFTPPVVYNWSLGVQRDIGWNLIADVAYVGNAGARSARSTGDINGRPYGYAYQPSSLDPTNVVGRAGAAAAGRLPAAVSGLRRDPAARVHRLLRLPLAAVLGESPAIVRRPVGRRRLHLPDRRTRRLGAIDPFVEDNARGTTRQNGRRPHTLVVNYSYDVPNLSQKWDNVVAKAIFDNWQISGHHDVHDAAPMAGSRYSYTNVPTGALTRHRRDQRRRRAASSSPAIRTCRGASARSSGSSGPSASRRRRISSVSARR